MAKLKYYKRRFLNKDSGLACLDLSVDQWAGGFYLDATVSIQDCSRRIDLDFSMGGVKDVERQKAKLYNFIQDLQQMHNFLEENTERIVNGFKAKEEKRKDKNKRRTVTTEIFSDDLQ